MTYHYTPTMVFPNTEEGESPGWTTDCGNKKDYDPMVVHISSRAYPDGDYCFSVYAGETEVFDNGIQRTSSQLQARAEIERLAEEHAAKINQAIRDLYSGATERALVERQRYLAALIEINKIAETKEKSSLMANTRYAFTLVAKLAHRAMFPPAGDE